MFNKSKLINITNRNQTIKRGCNYFIKVDIGFWSVESNIPQVYILE